VITVRPAAPGDVPEILRLVRQLAAYEREPDAVVATPEHLATALFPAAGAPLVHAHVATVDGAVAGIAIWFVSFSTWEGRHGIYLEDLFVMPAHRATGVGRALLAELAAEAVRREYRRLEWSVLDWNEPARRFYESIGAAEMTSWVPNRLTGPALHALADDASGPPDAAAP
jgi:GNAT superfamily N-acetyltransferase